MTDCNHSHWQPSHDYRPLEKGAEKQTWAVVLLTGLAMVAEIVAGYWFNSMALLADGWHMASHMVAIGMSAITAWAWASTHSRSSTRKFLTSTVSCTVSAVTVGTAWQPWAISASMSACRPAPPLGSWPERQRTTGREQGPVINEFPECMA